jgi:hypothetical protein
MSTLFEQEAEPQIQSTNRRKRPSDPTRSPICKCGSPKKKVSTRCVKCRINDAQSPEDLNVYLIEGKPCRKVSLTQEQYAIVDEEDFARVAAFAFCARWYPTSHGFYAGSTQAALVMFGKDAAYTLAAFILRLPLGTLVDHENGNTLDNRKSNLRPATYQQNAMNRRIRSDNTTGFKGVRKLSSSSWQAYIFVEEKMKLVAITSCPKLAARIRDLFSLQYFGEFAKFNFPESINEYREIVEVAKMSDIDSETWEMMVRMTCTKP